MLSHQANQTQLSPIYNLFSGNILSNKLSTLESFIFYLLTFMHVYLSMYNNNKDLLSIYLSICLSIYLSIYLYNQGGKALPCGPGVFILCCSVVRKIQERLLQSLIVTTSFVETVPSVYTHLMSTIYLT